MVSLDTENEYSPTYEVKENEVKEKLRKESFKKQNDFETESDNKNTINKEDISERVIDDANKYFLVKILSPEITNNELKKREHKDKLIKIVQLFLIFQFIILLGLLFSVIIMIFVFHGLNNDLDLSYIETIIKFISLYITSVVVELIAMLKYIVSNVFDTSITGLVGLYKDVTNKETRELTDNQSY